MCGVMAMSPHLEPHWLKTDNFYEQSGVVLIDKPLEIVPSAEVVKDVIFVNCYSGASLGKAEVCVFK